MGFPEDGHSFRSGPPCGYLSAGFFTEFISFLLFQHRDASARAQPVLTGHDDLFPGL